MSSSTYYELLKHPRWQKKRLEILERAGFSCEYCGESELMLHVHHAYYEKGLAPWDYPDESLHCLCEKCHKLAQDQSTLLHRQIGKVDLSDLGALLGFAMGLEVHSYPMVVLDVYSYEVADGLGKCWGLEAEEVINALIEGQIDGYKLFELRKVKYPGRYHHMPTRPAD